MNLFNEANKITQAFTTTQGAAGQTTITGGTLDMQGFDGVIFLSAVGTIEASGVQSLKWQSGAQSDMSDAADLLGTGITIADDDDDKVQYNELLRPKERYVRVVISRATSDSTFGGGIYIQYRARDLEVTHDAATVSGEEHLSPAEGTA